MKTLTYNFAYRVLAGVFALSAASVAGATTVDITIPYSSGSGLNSGYWSTVAPGTGIQNAPTSGNTGTGVTFANWAGRYNEIATSQTTTFSLGSISLGDTTTFKTLINTFYGDSALDATVTFTNSNGATASYSLTGGVTDRDYNYNTFQNNLTGGSVASGVTAQNWWTNGTGQVLDMQTFYLPASWAGTNLTSLKIQDVSSSADIVLSAAQVTTTTTVTPEPSSFLLFGTGLIGVGGALRRRVLAR